MTFPRVRLYRVNLRPIRPLIVGGHRLSERFVLRIVTEDAPLRYVDCSPLEYLHQESFEDCLSSARSYFSGQKTKLPISLQTALGALSYRFALPKLGEWENSALLSPRNEDDCPTRVCKVKAFGLTLTELKDVLNARLLKYPNTVFRIDCNQNDLAFGAMAFKDLIETFPIQYLEEPCRSISELKSLARVLPIGLDENLGRDRELDALAKAWIIKPNVLGWDQTLLRFRDTSSSLKVLSNTYESHASLKLYAFLYAQTVQDPQALGFGTAYYFEDPRTTWSPKQTKGPWPSEPFSSDDFEGTLVWEN